MSKGKSWRLAGVVCAAVLAVTGWSGGSAKQAGHLTTAKRAEHRSTTASRKRHHVTLALAAGGTVRATLPAKPLATTGSIFSGISLEVWQVQRSGSAVTVVFSLHNTTNQTISDDQNLEDALDLNSGKTTSQAIQLEPVVNNVGLLDGSSLKDYETFCNTNSSGVLTDCLGSADTFYVNDIAFHPGDDMFFAAVVAAPPESTRRATLATGVGSVPNVPISG